MTNRTDFDPEEPDLHTRLQIIEERQQRQALAMQILGREVDRLTDKIKKMSRRFEPST